MKMIPTAWLAAGGLTVALVLLPASVRAQGGGPSSGSHSAAPPAGTPTPGNGAPVTLHVQGTPLRTALEMLFTGSGQQIAIEPGVPNDPVTLTIHGIPFDTALRTLLRLAPGVTYRKEGEIYIVGMRPPAPALTANRAEPPAPVATSATASEEEVVRIPLNYIHPAILAYVLGGRLIPTEDQFTPGVGGYAGGLSGLGGLGAYGGLSGGGLGPAGYGGFGGGPGAYALGSGMAGNSGGLGPNVLVNPLSNSVVIAPQPRY